MGETLQTAFTQEELATVSDAIVEACDTLDGLEDGVVFATAECQQRFDPATLICEGGQKGECLSEEKVAALETIHAGPRNSAGEQLYSTWPWDPGIDSGNWRFWKLESPVPSWANQPLIAVMGAGALAHIFTTPPTEVEGTPEALQAYLVNFDMDEDAPKIFAATEELPESPMEVMTPPSAEDPHLGEFQEAGGHMIVHHGVSDPVFSFHDTVEWYRKLIENNQDAPEFVRLYAVPGMPHVQGGNAADRMDLLGELIDWIENGEAPGAVPAMFRADNPEVRAENTGAARKLCPWPEHAVFTGDDPTSAKSFTCE